MTSLADRRPHIVFAGGVTGGHLFPGLAVAEQLTALEPGARITFAGPGSTFDREMVGRAGHEYLQLTCPRFPRGVAAGARFTYEMFHGYRTAKGHLRRTGATVVVGLGGFGSVPAAVAAARLRLPLVLLEQNAVVGRANRHIARWATCLCQGFDDKSCAPRGSDLTSCCPVAATGTPVRARFLVEQSECSTRSILLVLGGSGGARLLNQSVPRVLAALRGPLAGWSVVHQTGHADAAETAGAYKAAGIEATVSPFFNNLSEILAQTGMAVCRAGGSTLAELAVMRVPAILVPLAGATDNHQSRNAHALASAGAAVVVKADQARSHATVGMPLAGGFAERLQAQIDRLLAAPQHRARMSSALARLARPDAAARVARLVLRFADAASSRQSPVPAIFSRLPVLH